MKPNAKFWLDNNIFKIKQSWVNSNSRAYFIRITVRRIHCFKSQSRNRLITGRSTKGVEWWWCRRCGFSCVSTRSRRRLKSIYRVSVNGIYHFSICICEFNQHTNTYKCIIKSRTQMIQLETCPENPWYYHFKWFFKIRKPRNNKLFAGGEIIVGLPMVSTLLTWIVTYLVLTDYFKQHRLHEIIK